MAKQKSVPQAKKYQDLGFGVRISQNNERLINRDGSMNVTRKGGGVGAIHPYLHLVNAPWWEFLLWTLISYIIVNSFFALAYVGVGIENLSGGPVDEPFSSQFAHAYYFSVQTFTTVGYGSISPEKNSANIIASFEAMFGLMGFALITGVLYGRFSKPSAKIRFSKHALIAPYQKINGLMFRIVNRRKNNLIEMEAQVAASWSEEKNGLISQRYENLSLERSAVPLFPLNWTIVHPITENSPLYGLSTDDLIRNNTEILVMLKGYDDTFAQIVHARYSYKIQDILWGRKFTKIYYNDPKGRIILEVDRIDETEDAPLNHY